MSADFLPSRVAEPRPVIQHASYIPTYLSPTSIHLLPGARVGAASVAEHHGPTTYRPSSSYPRPFIHPLAYSEENPRHLPGHLLHQPYTGTSFVAPDLRDYHRIPAGLVRKDGGEEVLSRSLVANSRRTAKKIGLRRHTSTSPPVVANNYRRQEPVQKPHPMSSPQKDPVFQRQNWPARRHLGDRGHESNQYSESPSPQRPLAELQPVDSLATRVPTPTRAARSMQISCLITPTVSQHPDSVLQKQNTSDIYSHSNKAANPAPTYQMQVRQQPINARACGFGERDRRVIDPPPIIQMTVRDEAMASPSVVLSKDRYPCSVVHCTLWHADEDMDDTTMPDSGERRQQRRLMGTLVSSPFVGLDENGVEGCFFTFPDLSCRTSGRYRLRFALVILDPEHMGPGSKAPFQSVVISDVFNVYAAKDFPGMRSSTALTKELKRQGCLISVKKGNDRETRGSKGPGNERLGSSDSSDDDDDHSADDRRPKQKAKSKANKEKKSNEKRKTKT